MALQDKDGRAAEGIGTRKGYRVARHLLEFNPENPRDTTTPEWHAKIRDLAESLRHGYHDDKPLFCRLVAGKYRVIDGNRRLTAIDLLISEGVEFGNLPVERVPADMDDADCLAVALRPGSEPLTPLEAAAQIAKLRRLQWTEQQIAERTGQRVEWVRSHLALNGAAAEIKTAVREGVLAHTEAVRMVRHDPAPVATLEAAKAVAAARGSRAVRPRDIEATKSREPRLDPAHKAILRFLAVWDSLRRRPEIAQELLIQIEALREVVP